MEEQDALQQRRKRDAIARIHAKERIIRLCEATLARNDTPPEHQAFLRKRIAQARKYLQEHEHGA